jgi:hypothetical protein
LEPSAQPQLVEVGLRRLGGWLHRVRCETVWGAGLGEGLGGGPPALANRLSVPKTNPKPIETLAALAAATSRARSVQESV